MHIITDDFKKKIAKRYHSSNDTNEPFRTDTDNQWINNAEIKFMQHFETINVNHTDPQDVGSEDYEYKFRQTIEDYKTRSSAIQNIVDFYQDSQKIVTATVPFCQVPTVYKNNTELIKKINLINQFYEGKEPLQIKLDSEKLLDFQVYSTILNSFGRRNRLVQFRNAIVRDSINKLPVFSPAKQNRDFEVDTRQLEQHSLQQLKSIKTVKLILLEIVNEKKRKGYGPDYFYAMEMKLLELLDYILKDEPQYSGLNATAKTRLVLKNLQSFKGKQIEGESKINLLKIFFQQFAVLKREKDHYEEMKTPMKKIDNNKTVRVTSHNKISKNGSKMKNKSGSSIKKIVHGEFSKSKVTKTFLKSTKQSKQDEWLGSFK